MAKKRRNASQDYFAKFKDPRWQRKRLKILERDNWECTGCGEKECELHVHHGYYESNLDPWDYQDETLHTLCDDCHRHANDLRRDLHFECAKLWIEAQHCLLDFVAAMRDELRNGEMLCLLSDQTRKIRRH